MTSLCHDVKQTESKTGFRQKEDAFLIFNGKFAFNFHDSGESGKINEILRN